MIAKNAKDMQTASISPDTIHERYFQQNKYMEKNGEKKEIMFPLLIEKSLECSARGSR